MDAKRIVEIKAACDAATPGPWDGCFIRKGEITRRFYWSDEDSESEYLAQQIERPEDTDFIALARTALPELLAALEVETKRADKAEQQLVAAREILDVFKIFWDAQEDSQYGWDLLAWEACEELNRLKQVYEKNKFALELLGEKEEEDI